jgi:hypothetical protein
MQVDRELALLDAGSTRQARASFTVDKPLSPAFIEDEEGQRGRRRQRGR